MLWRSSPLRFPSSQLSVAVSFQKREKNLNFPLWPDVSDFIVLLVILPLTSGDYFTDTVIRRDCPKWTYQCSSVNKWLIIVGNKTRLLILLIYYNLWGRPLVVMHGWFIVFFFIADTFIPKIKIKSIEKLYILITDMTLKAQFLLFQGQASWNFTHFHLDPVLKPRSHFWGRIVSTKLIGFIMFGSVLLLFPPRYSPLGATCETRNFSFPLKHDTTCTEAISPTQHWHGSHTRQRAFLEWNNKTTPISNKKF